MLHLWRFRNDIQIVKYVLLRKKGLLWENSGKNIHCWKRKDYSEKAQETGFPSKLEEQHFHQLTVTINSKERGWKLRDSDNQKVFLAFGIRFSWQKSWWQLTGCEKGGKIGAVSLGDTRKRHERQRVNVKCGKAAGTPLSFFFL